MGTQEKSRLNPDRRHALEVWLNDFKCLRFGITYTIFFEGEREVCMSHQCINQTVEYIEVIW